MGAEVYLPSDGDPIHVDLHEHAPASGFLLPVLRWRARCGGAGGVILPEGADRRPADDGSGGGRRRDSISSEALIRLLLQQTT